MKFTIGTNPGSPLLSQPRPAAASAPTTYAALTPEEIETLGLLCTFVNTSRVYVSPGIGVSYEKFCLLDFFP